MSDFLDVPGCKKRNVNIVDNFIFSHSASIISNNPRIVVILVGKTFLKTFVPFVSISINIGL